MSEKRKDVPLDVIERWIRDDDWRVRAAAMNACQGKDVPLDVIERGIRDDDWRVRAAAMNACQGKDVPLDVIERWIRDDDCDVWAAAMNACQGKDVPLDVIERWIRDDDWCVRAAAMNACQGKDVPLDVIERGIRDDDCDVRAAAMKLCEKSGIQIPIIRTFEPPHLVYKRCCDDVIIVAEIPKDAQVRGSYGHKCRANKAIVKDVIGDFGGESVGISIYDQTTTYYAGDEVEIENFDMSDKECSTGFHFFCTREEAESYK